MPAPSTRSEALLSWQQFLPRIREYAARRNHVITGHAHVSRLSAAIRHRLISEDELIHDSLQQHKLSVVEKWLQEVCWRRYWKGWLEMRPDVWSSWRRRVAELRRQLPADILVRADAVCAGKGGVACMDVFAKELTDTGYLHNHARMWWASYWVHVEQLPWELGADFFFRHLLDADPASNTLSWRWVAGLQTVGKTYLVRLSNLQKYASDDHLANSAGSARIADGAVAACPQQERADTTRRILVQYPSTIPACTHRRGLWLHADDLSPETGPLATLEPVAVAAFTNQSVYQGHYQLSDQRISYLRAVLQDGIDRAAAHYHCAAALIESEHSAQSLVQWAKEQQLAEIVAMAPTIGPVHDLLPKLKIQLEAAGIRLTLIRRASVCHAFSLAGAGFFPFWEKMSRHLKTSTETQTELPLF